MKAYSLPKLSSRVPFLLGSATFKVKERRNCTYLFHMKQNRLHLRTFQALEAFHKKITMVSRQFIKSTTFNLIVAFCFIYQADLNLFNYQWVSVTELYNFPVLSADHVFIMEVRVLGQKVVGFVGSVVKRYCFLVAY